MASNNPNYIDPNFFLPPGVVDMGYELNDPSDDPAYENDETIFPDNNGDTGTVDVGGGSPGIPAPTTPGGNVVGAIPVPENIRLISQTIRKSSKGGAQVVDVLIEVDDNPRIAQLGVRLTPL